jgi:hypothetical protein
MERSAPAAGDKPAQEEILRAPMKNSRSHAQSVSRSRKRVLRQQLGVAPRSLARMADRKVTPGVGLSKRLRSGERNQQLPFVPPENWHEPRETVGRYRMIVQTPGVGFRHVLTPEDVRERLSRLPERFLAPLEVVQFSHMTRKKQSFPCYGMQWGSAIYLYPIEESLTEQYSLPPKPSQIIEARQYGGKWRQTGPDQWQLEWTLEALRDFYLNNVLIHELGHLLDDRNSRHVERERYAEWFAMRWGYPHSRARAEVRPRSVQRRHHRRSA